MPLSNLQLKNLKPLPKTKKYADERGLYIEVSPKGGKWWRLKYRIDGKEKRISLGVFPDVSLKDARTKREEYRMLIAKGIDPSQERKAKKKHAKEEVGLGFRSLAEAWLSKQEKVWNPAHAKRVKNRLVKDVFPFIGSLNINEVKPPLVLSCLRRIEARGSIETAHRNLTTISQICRFAIASGHIEHDPTFGLKPALAKKQVVHFSATTDPKEVGELLRALDSYKGTIVVETALKLAPLVFVRPGELRHAKWSDIDLTERKWSYIASKTNQPHIVPLSRQAVKLLTHLQPYTSDSIYVFPSARSYDRPMSDNAILAAMRRMGIPKDQMTGHGFRAIARTLLDEQLKFRPDIIEQQLAHSVRDPHGRAYNRTKFLDERREMMQAWADYLEKLRSGK